MKNPLQLLVGLKVTNATVVHDYAQICFEGNTYLTINNDYIISECKTLADLTEQTLLDTFQSKSEVMLKFENGIAVSISLLPQAYHGPEALVLHRKDEPIVVWN